jgi:hypothetical protein
MLETILCRTFPLYVSDQIQNLQNCFTTTNINLGGEGASKKINTCRKVPLQVNFLNNDF